MKAIVFIGTNKSGTSRTAFSATVDLGFHTVLFTNRKKFLSQRDEFPDVKEMVYIDDLLNKKLVLEEISKLVEDGKEICACISLIDPFVSYAAEINEELGTARLSVSALKRMENKILVREILRDSPYSPYYETYSHEKELSAFSREYNSKLPIILKSPISNGSKDVIYVETPGKFKQALNHLQKKLTETPILLEEFLDGPQYLIEVMVYKGQIHIIAVIEQEIEQKERFIVTGYVYPAQLEMKDQQELIDSVETIVRSFGLTNGVCHLEMKKTQSGWKLIEINPRVSGGAMNRILLEGKGMNYVKEIIKLYLGSEPDLHYPTKRHVYARFLTIDSRGRLLRVTGKNRALRIPGIKEVYIKPKRGTVLSVPHSLGDRYAYVVAASQTREEAREQALEAAQEIKFYLEPF